MPQLVVHVKKDGSERPEPAYAVWVSDTDASVRAFGPEWEPTAARRSRYWQVQTRPCGSLDGKGGR
jgi:hypothetical protein